MMSRTVREIAQVMEEWAAWDTAESWDNSGVLLDMGEYVTGVMCALDITPKSIEAARRADCNVMVVHHPVIFKPLTRLVGQDLTVQLVRYGISAICAHTNLDCAKGGTSDTLLQAVGLKAANENYEGLLRVGELEGPVLMEEFAGQVAQRLNTEVLYSGVGQRIRRVGVVSGAGGSFFQEAARCGCDCLLTGEASHHHAIDAAQAGIAIAAAGHFATERLIVPVMAKRLRASLEGLKIFEYEKECAPFRLVCAGR